MKSTPKQRRARKRSRRKRNDKKLAIIYDKIGKELEAKLEHDAYFWAEFLK
jgi:hypothetical protein